MTTIVEWNLHINPKSQNPRTLPFSMMPRPTHFHTHVIDECQPESIITSLQEKFRNFCTDIDIGNNDDISTRQTFFFQNTRKPW